MGALSFLRSGVLVWAALAASLVLIFVWMPSWPFSVVTLSLDVHTETLSFEVDDEGSFELQLPAGMYVALAATTRESCTEVKYEIACPHAAATTLEVTGAGIRMVVLEPFHEDSGVDSPRLQVTVTPLPGTASRFRVWDSDPIERKLLLETTGDLAFVSDEVRLWRAPLAISNVVLGEPLSEFDRMQPILSEGLLRFFARSAFFPRSGRFPVFDERFDRGDAVELARESCPMSWGRLWQHIRFWRPDDRCERTLVGLISLEVPTEGDGPAVQAFDVTLHATESDVQVHRLRASHVITLPNWMIVSKRPALIAFWAVFVSLMLIVTYIEDRKISHDIARDLNDKK